MNFAWVRIAGVVALCLGSIVSCKKPPTPEPQDPIRTGTTNQPGSGQRPPVAPTIVSNPNPDKLVWIAPGSFVMGSPNAEAGHESRETPQTTVTLSRGFYMGKYEVTQGEYESLMGLNPSHFTGDPQRPVERVNWYDATNYCGRLTSREEQAGRLPSNWIYRLPTEVEWEYACRAGTTTRFSFGNSEGRLDNHAWHKGNSGGTTHPVGAKQPNAWGLYDLHGNVWEWGADWCEDSLPGGKVTDPKRPKSGSIRTLRGGGWSSHSWQCRSAYRGDYAPASASFTMGFRVVLAPAAN